MAEGEIEESGLSHNNAAIPSPGHMNVTKRVYVLMLSLIIVLSGCLGGTTNGEEEEEDGDTTIINNYWNNTTIEPEPEIFAANGEGGAYVAIITINQSSGEAIHLLDATGSYTDGYGIRELRYLAIWTNCTNGMQWFDGYIDVIHGVSPAEQWFAGAGLECTHELQPQGQDSNAELDERLSIVYERHAVTIE